MFPILIIYVECMDLLMIHVTCLWSAWSLCDSLTVCPCCLYVCVWILRSSYNTQWSPNWLSKCLHENWIISLTSSSLNSLVLHPCPLRYSSMFLICTLFPHLLSMKFTLHGTNLDYFRTVILFSLNQTRKSNPKDSCFCFCQLIFYFGSA